MVLMYSNYALMNHMFQMLAMLFVQILRFLSACDSPLLGQAGTVCEKGGGFSRPPAFLSQEALAAPWELE